MATSTWLCCFLLFQLTFFPIGCEADDCNQSDFELTLLHANDMHSRIEETSKYSSACSKADRDAGKCFGGFARMKTVVNDFRSENEHVLFLIGGDLFQGTLWFTHFKERALVELTNDLEFSALAIGNHEFDLGIAGLVSYLQNVTYPVISANLDVTKEPTLKGLFTPSVTLNMGGRKVGIIGYTTTDTPHMDADGEVVFNDEIEAVRSEAKKLDAAGVKIIIALGHSGYIKDQMIAKQVEEVDVVVGGHSHSFLYSGSSPSNERPVGPYPTLVKQDNTGKIVPVVQDYAYTKYLGHLELLFDKNGDLQWHCGNPILLNSSFSEDPKMLKIMKPYQLDLDKFRLEVTGETLSDLLITRESESTLGNFVTDAMVDWFTQRGLTNITLAIHNSGGLRTPIPKGNITTGSILNLLPFRNAFDVVSLLGKHLKEAFERSVNKLSLTGPPASDGGFLQVSGFKLTIDVTLSVGDRLTEILVRGEDGSLKPIEMERVYQVIMPGFLAGGGDNYPMIVNNKLRHIQGPLDTDAILAYVKANSPIDQGLENRITILRT